MHSLKPVLIFLLPVLLSAVAQAQTPATPATDTAVIATVLDRKITASDRDRLSGIILGALLEKFATDNSIEPAPEELDAFTRKTEEKRQQHEVEMQADRQKLQQELKDPSLADAERQLKQKRLQSIERILESSLKMETQSKAMEEQMRPMQRQMAHQFVRAWKINKALYKKYGGRIIFQQAGVEPVDAYRDFLREQEKLGAFRILDRQYEAGFWRYFTNDAMHTFYPGDEGEKFINIPWWLMDEPVQ